LVLPKAILFDLDDTLISAYNRPERAWHEIVDEFAGDLGDLAPRDAAEAINRAAAGFWADASRHKSGRLNLLDARSAIIQEAFDELARSGRPSPPPPVSRRMAARYNDYRNERMHLFEGALHVVDTFREMGVRLALITNGAAEPQRAKVKRFDLTHRFHHIQIEGEAGFGKPEERAYRHAMGVLGVEPQQTWMVGDNLEWEIIAPQKLGIHAIWHDVIGDGLPADTDARPDRIIRSLPELLDGLA
jgi:putative hydrolase of the HAD superfamily